MYTLTNFRTKRELKDAVASGKIVTVFQPGGLFEAKQEGTVTVEGPHYPEPHRWYARVELVAGRVVRVIS